MHASKQTIKHIKKRQIHASHVDTKYKVAYFDPVIVEKELNRRERTPIMQFFNCKTMARTIIGQTWHFLLIFFILYSIIQLAYQFDLLCPKGNMKTCAQKRQELAKYFTIFNEYERVMTKIITFLLGFYVSTIARRWWEQVGKMPDADTIGLVLGGLVWSKSDPGPASYKAGLEFRKTILRYCLLSWTMCLSRISCPLREKYLKVQDYIDKNLMTREEANAMKLDAEDAESTERWWIPLSWTTCMIANAFNQTQLVPKDHKDVVSVITKFRTDLHQIAEYRLKPLPAIYEQAVWLAVWGWVLFGTVANQNPIHCKEEGTHIGITVLLSFPAHELLMYMLVFSWLRVADIMSNPFGNDEGYDVDLVSTLEHNIWKASLTVEHQEKAIHSPLLKIQN